MTDDRGKVWPSDYGCDDRYAYMRICPTCFGLYETGRPDGEEQRCACRPDGERWPHHDFNERAILCWCCGLNVLPSGSRWSSFFCRECQLLAMGVSVWNRQLIIPIGRHSLMHSWVPNTPSASLSQGQNQVDDLVSGVHGTISGIARGRDGLGQWYRTVMALNLKHFELRGDVSLREYMEAVAAEAPALSTRLEAFEGLCRLFQSSPPPAPRKN